MNGLFSAAIWFPLKHLALVSRSIHTFVTLLLAQKWGSPTPRKMAGNGNPGCHKPFGDGLSSIKMVMILGIVLMALGKTKSYHIFSDEDPYFFVLAHTRSTDVIPGFKNPSPYSQHEVPFSAVNPQRC